MYCLCGLLWALYLMGGLYGWQTRPEEVPHQAKSCVRVHWLSLRILARPTSHSDEVALVKGWLVAQNERNLPNSS